MIKRVLPLVLVLVVLTIGLWQFNNIRDWWFLRSYDPSPEVAALAERTSMTSEAKRDFYLGDPKIDSKEDFNHHCPVTERSLVLGCYNDGKIYVLNVKQDELAKVMDVTAAHEMLHSAYENLSRSEREQVDGWLNSYYSTVTDQNFINLIKEYDTSQPGTRANELHSLLGTQMPKLSPELEQYYSRYFSNRAEVVTAYNSYESVFRSIESQQENLKEQIDDTKEQLDTLEAKIDREYQELQNTNQQLDAYLDSGNTAAYNNLVPTQNSQVRQYNSDVERYKTLVITYNELVDKYNTLSVRQNELVESLDATDFQPAN